MRRADKTKEERFADSMMLLAMIVAVVGMILALAFGHRAGMALLLAGTAMFVWGCCAYARSRGRTWALGLWSILPIFLARGAAGQCDSRDIMEVLGFEMGRTLMSFAFGFGLIWLITGCGRRRNSTMGRVESMPASEPESHTPQE